MKKIKLSEDMVSMFLGLLVVVGLVIVIFNYFQKRKGSVEVPGVSQTNQENISTSPAGGSDYIVLRGDNLWKIAVRAYGNGYEWVKIWQENNLKDPDKLVVGQKLRIPDLKIVTANSYTVERGDSLWKISVKTYGDGFRWGELWQANKTIIKNPDLIYRGAKLSVPVLK